MNKPLHHFFTTDHHRIDELLEKAVKNPENMESNYYHQFRTGLLRHIKMEENILFPAARKIDGAKMKALIPRFRLEHGALTALMVPPPDVEVVKAIKYLLEKHDEAEEKPGGLYDVCEALTKDQTQELLEQLSQISEVPVNSHNSARIAYEAAKRALERAGYDYGIITSEE